MTGQEGSASLSEKFESRSKGDKGIINSKAIWGGLLGKGNGDGKM